MFVDEVILKVTAGKGGDGCTSFRREKFIPFGGPNGGNGGNGSDIIFKVEKGLKTLVDLKYAKQIKGNKGTNGKGSDKNGAKAEDIIIKVPEGTTIVDNETGLILCDLIHDGDEYVVCHGGRGGRGNKAFATQENPAPKMSEYGEPGEERIIKCELKVLADVGLVGMPSVGKSTILSLISGANPKIGAYHFTTLSPNLGVVKLKDQSTYVIADLPGLIEGASNGAGLGEKFLKHAMRTKVIAHVIDMGSFEGRDPIDDYKVIRQELEQYSEKLAKKPELIIANKMDLEASKNNLEKFKKSYPNLEIVEVSAYNQTGLDEMILKLGELVKNTELEPIYEETKYESHVIYKFKNEKPYTISRDDSGVWIIKGDEIEKLLKMTKFQEDESVERFARKLRGMGVDDELERLGAQKGDDVQILDFMFTFKE
ncbi:MAG TPA: GTPase ObgE [Firmicutes bacterium]|nr:GTPase ObgE [Bacillota bacterium]